ncbi:MAG: hypothetical protein BroJett040_00620 [Oligoflexia bacterium]|nr:MAG: hypothetical protein BroJett040_00620 [Oligoflexia bacterium]
MSFQSEPKPIQKALVVAAKFGYLRKEIFWKYLTSTNQSYKYELWGRLLKSGYLREYNRIGVAQHFYSLSKKGLSLLRDQGYVPIGRAHPLHFEHDDVVMNFVLAAENSDLIRSEWVTERMLRSMKASAQVNNWGRVFDKLPDALFEINLEQIKIQGALEVERTRKVKKRYDAFVLAYAKHQQIDFVLVAYHDSYVVHSIQDSMNRLGYPQRTRPILFCKINDLMSFPAAFDLEIENRKIKFHEYVQNMQSLARSRLETETRSHSGNFSGHNGEAA